MARRSRRSCGNVVVASVANFGTELVTEDTGNFYLEDYPSSPTREPRGPARGHGPGPHKRYVRRGRRAAPRHPADRPAGWAQRIPSLPTRIYQKYAEAQWPSHGTRGADRRAYRFYGLQFDLPRGYYEGISVTDLLAGEFPAELSSRTPSCSSAPTPPGFPTT